MRLADAILRGGHLSERGIVKAVMTGERPGHIDRCDICASRAVDLGRWLDQVRDAGAEAADAAFPPDRLLVQQQQILRRLEQLDQPARVIAFPQQYQLSRDMGGHRIAPGWLAVAAAAGILVGALGGQFTQGLRSQPAEAPAAAAVAASPAARDTATTSLASAGTTMLDEDWDRIGSPGLRTLDQMTPSLMQVSNVTVHR